MQTRKREGRGKGGVILQRENFFVFPYGAKTKLRLISSRTRPPAAVKLWLLVVNYRLQGVGQKVMVGVGWG